MYILFGLVVCSSAVDLLTPVRCLKFSARGQQGSAVDGQSSTQRSRGGWPGDGLCFNFAHKNGAFWCAFHTILHSQLA